MNRKIAKEVLHLRDWFSRVQEIVESGKDRYDSDELLQEAGDSLMMKIGEAAARLARAGVVGPVGVEWNDAIANRNWLIHQYDEIDRDITWSTLTKDLAVWRAALRETFAEAAACLAAEWRNWSGPALWFGACVIGVAADVVGVAR